jgi:hypothetical protein
VLQHLPRKECSDRTQEEEGIGGKRTTFRGRRIALSQLHIKIPNFLIMKIVMGRFLNQRGSFAFLEYKEGGIMMVGND